MKKKAQARVARRVQTAQPTSVAFLRDRQYRRHLREIVLIATTLRPASLKALTVWARLLGQLERPLDVATVTRKGGTR